MCHLEASGSGRSLCPGGHVAAGVVLCAAGLIFDAVHNILHSSAPAAPVAPDPDADVIAGLILGGVVVMVLLIAAVTVRHLRTAAQPRLQPLTRRSVAPASSPPVVVAVPAEAFQVEHEGATMVLTADGVEKREAVSP